jgi:Fe-S-cluster-containing hydrogenase component 2
MWRSTGSTPCQKFCPVDALSGSIDADGHAEEMVFDMHACAQMCQQYEIMPNLLARALSATDPLEREHALFGPEVQGYFYKVTTGIGATNAQCFECMRVCPVVAKAPQGDPIRRSRRNH